VSIIEKIKCKIGRLNLKNKQKNLKRRVQTHNFNTASSAGILFSPSDQESFDAVKDFLSYLTQNNMKVIALGYYPGQKIPEEYLMLKGINFYCNTDLNWYYKPKNEVVNQFINQDFDILFDLNLNDHFTTEYVGSLSKANFKVGKSSENPYQDLVIDINKNQSVEYLTEQIKHYLNILNQ